MDGDMFVSLGYNLNLDCEIAIEIGTAFASKSRI